MRGGLRSKRRHTESEQIDPLSGAINIVDAMLVFACGLMLSLVIHWNVDLGQPGTRVDLSQGQDVTQTLGIQENLIESQDQGKVYEKLGTDYKDPTTGQLFMLSK